MRISLKMLARFRSGVWDRRRLKQIVNEVIIYSSAPIAAKLLKGLVHDALDLVDRVGLAVDRQQWRRLGEIDRTDHTLDLG
jgi:hypothetical protein